MNFYGLEMDEHQKEFVGAILDPDKTIVFVDAAAGTGKTTLAFGAAKMLVTDKRNDLDGIIYIVSPYGEQKQGYLPGSYTEKSEIYFEPAYQALQTCNMNPYTDVYNESLTSKKKGDGYVKMLTHTFLRGVNLEKKVVIIDEAQNYTAAELKKVLTRIHDDCKVIVIGHSLQCDTKERSGFVPYMKHFEGQEPCQICKLTKNYRGWLSSYADEFEE